MSIDDQHQMPVVENCAADQGDEANFVRRTLISGQQIVQPNDQNQAIAQNVVAGDEGMLISQQPNAMQPKSVPDQLSTSTATANAVPTNASGHVKHTSDGKTRRSNKSSERIPKLVILSVQHGTLVDCSMESKLKTIKFKFDISDVNPIDVANDLVRKRVKRLLIGHFAKKSAHLVLFFQISKDLLSTSQRNVFADMVRDIVRQLKLNPNQIPVPTTSHRRTGSALEKVRFHRFFPRLGFYFLSSFLRNLLFDF